MRKSQFTEEQIIGFIKEVDAGADAKAVCRRIGVHPGTLYAWKKKYGGLDVNEARRLRALEDENRRLKQMVAEQALDLQGLRFLLTKKF